MEHLLVIHYVLICEPRRVADLAAYLDYWRSKVETGTHMQEFCSIVKADVVKKHKAKGGMNKGAKRTFC